MYVVIKDWVGTLNRGDLVDGDRLPNTNAAGMIANGSIADAEDVGAPVALDPFVAAVVNVDLITMDDIYPRP